MCSKYGLNKTSISINLFNMTSLHLDQKYFDSKSFTDNIKNWKLTVYFILYYFSMHKEDL